ncbi:hypothetical protein DVH05_011702 [Phytophthora capsici]|nr:hypothetical protein DVH05_011702 [Phytophthora capsici]|eukprot:jgi/Phyca11/7555/fgenesh1_pm.PHYCAscaffold_20_\
MTMDRSERRVCWALYRDVTCSESSYVLSGSLPLAQVHVAPLQTKQNSSELVSKFTLESTGFQLVPELQQRAWNLLEKQQACNDQDGDDVFPIAVEDLTLGSQAAALTLNGETSLYCKLQLDRGEDIKAAERQEADWFLWKLTRATEYRVRGNEAFKKESYRSAVKLYERALAWLEPPTSRSEVALDEKIEYSAGELQQVNPVAVACYANMATCYSKLDGDGDVDRCVAAASKALELDDAHVKARYRRSQAYLMSKKFDLAVADLNKLRELEPGNKLFRSAFTRAQTAKTQFRKKQQSAFANLFAK